ncbi:STM4015 family protein [Paenibacillus senegalensis]|uniref:STM4015 family protein n=1 Tax=Paenibacillus senegalensis TaxID=1465766 RepID=UPI00028A09BC|nr:STM4015 family protein [Paenibacillus senegalensis]
MSEIKLVIDYEAYESGKTMTEGLEQLAASSQSQELTRLVIGDWGGSYENDSSEIVATLIRLKDQFPKLRELFIGDMEFDECEVSWIMQSNLGPILDAFPELTSLTIKGSTGLELDPARHDKLEELIIICGGLDKQVLSAISEGHFPSLKKLELYLGVEDYGFNGTLDDVMKLIEPGRFPQLRYLGLKDSIIQDEIAIAIAEHPILEQLHTLDLSLGVLTDKGGEALLQSEKIRKLEFLDLKYHYMSDKMVNRWKKSGLNVDVSEQQEEEEEEYRYPFLTE